MRKVIYTEKTRKSLDIEQETLQILPFRMIDVHRMVGRLIQTVENAYAASCLGGCGKDREGE